ncbi:hypothetical protein [Symbioplanes lichenis]|uniref:hypothetical protein n=1 Tax=Symbioplanes lichenis TaxID=1629072 RepID=UPI0027399419|nr:hypothetical protein [Actinoplanes lichenis]
MTEVLVDHAPRVRCHECGSAAVFSVCHHCQRPMCEEHTPDVLQQSDGVLRKSAGSAEVRAISREFAGLHLGSGLREAVHHCADHDHLVKDVRWRVVGAGAAVAVLGFLLTFASAGVGVTLLLLGALVAGGELAYHRWAAARHPRPPVPIVPQVSTVDLVEQLTGYVRLEQDGYTTTVDNVAGALTVRMSANDGHTVLQAYRRKFKVPAPDPVEFAGGFLLLEGRAGLAFRAGQPEVLGGGAGISLGGSSAGEYGLVPTDPERQHRAHTLAIDYEVQDGRKPAEIPLWIVPSLVQGSDRRAMEIDLHWADLGPDGEELELTGFELIELRVPLAWGDVDGAQPAGVETGKDGDRRLIRWQQVARPREESARSLTLRLQFERPITEVPEAATGDRSRLTLSGNLRATFRGLLSGVTGATVYLPGGGRGNQPQVTAETKVSVAFDVSIRSLRYQDVRVVPDENRPGDVAARRTEPDEFAGVVPDPRTVAELTNGISADNFYVKSVVEHLPFRDDGRPNVVNRVWDITGRLYLGVFPIDFDINLRGEEAGPAGALTGKTVAQVTVKGAYALGTLVDRDGDGPGTAVVEPDGRGDELLERIESTWAGLHDRVVQLLAGRASGARGIGGPPEDVLSGEVLDPARETRNGSARTAWTGAGPEAVVLDMPPGPVSDAEARRRAADEAVVNGTISEETHRGIIARIEAELGGQEGTR